MRVGQADLRPGCLLASVATRRGTSDPIAEAKPARRTRPAVSPDVGGQLRAGGIDAPDDLGGAVGQQLPGRGEPDPAADPLQQLRAGLGLEPAR
jgi:hypothetical protein